MLTELLVPYLKLDTDINTLVGGRIYRSRLPQACVFPNIVVYGLHDLDEGQTCGEDLTREIGSYYITVQTDKALDSISSLLKAVRKRLKLTRQIFIPTNSSNPKMWVQCIIIKDVIEFSNAPVDGNEVPFVGYRIELRSGYDELVTG